MPPPPRRSTYATVTTTTGPRSAEQSHRSYLVEAKKQKKKKKKKKSEKPGVYVGRGEWKPRESDAPGIDLERMHREKRLALSQKKEHVSLAEYTPVSTEESERYHRENEARMEAALERSRQPRQPTPPVPTVSMQPAEEEHLFSGGGRPDADGARAGRAGRGIRRPTPPTTNTPRRKAAAGW